MCIGNGFTGSHTFALLNLSLRQCDCHAGPDTAGAVQGGQVCDIEGAAPPHPADARLRVTAATQLEISHTDSKG